MTIDLTTITLASGGHKPGDVYCLEELTDALAGETWSDNPRCACPVIAAYGRVLNDRLSDADRQRLLPYAARQIGTRSTRSVEQKREYLCADYAVRRFAPIVLRLRGLTELADRLASLPPIVDRKTARSAQAAAAAAVADGAAYAAYAAYGAAAVDPRAVDLALELFDALLAMSA